MYIIISLLEVNNLIIQYGEVSLSQQISTYSSPANLTSNGTIGGNSFAVLPSGEVSGNEAWHMFDGSPSTYFKSETKNPITVIVYTPQLTNIKSVSIVNQDTYCISNSADSYLYGSTDNSDYTLLATFRGTTGGGTQWTISLANNQDYYKYYKFVTRGFYGYQTFRNMSLTGYYMTTVANSITFPTSYTSTNYSFSLGNVGSYNTTYCLSKQTSGMSLYNPEASSGTMNWTTIGF